MSSFRTLQEQVGVALNATSLRIEARDPGAETSLLRVACLGAAVLHIQHGADKLGPQGRGGPVAEALSQANHEPEPLDQIAGELAGVLYHLRYGGQHELVCQAITLFAAYIALRRRFGPEGFLAALETAARAQLLRRFAERSLHEWLSDRCVACGGSGKLERSESGSWIRPRGQMKRNATFRVCPTCQGSRRALPSHTARRKALDITFEQYERQGWSQNFRASFTWLGRDLGRLYRPLTVQLERVKKRV
jgi:hypothetical protein